MFGLFKSKPPLGPLEKAWTENRMQWLASEFGLSRLIETPTLVPDYAGIPDATNYDEAIVLLDFLRAWINIDAPDVRLQIHGAVVTPDMISKPDDIDNPVVVSIRQEDFEHRDTLIAALSRGLAYGAMAERGLNEVVAADNGWTAELLPAFLGLGAFAANATIQDSNYSDAIYTSWSVARRGPLPSRVFGYAMALRHLVRGDQTHAWSSMLRQDAKVAFEEGIKYLQKTGDSIFNHESTQQQPGTPSLESLADALKNGTPSRKIAAMWDLSESAASDNTTDSHRDRIGDLLMDCVRSREADVRTVAVAALPKFDKTPHGAQEIAEALTDSSSDVRATAAGALGDFVGVDDLTLVQDLMTALKDDCDEVVFGAVSSLAKFGSAAEPATKTILSRLRRGFVNCNDGEAWLFMNALVQIADDPESKIRAIFDESDVEYLDDALALLARARGDETATVTGLEQ